MKIYVAGSFKNSEEINRIGNELRKAGHECYIFCEPGCETLKLSQEMRAIENINEMTPKSIYTSHRLNKIGELNFDALQTCDAVVLVLPCGRSAHLEAGYMIGHAGPVFVIGPMVKGEFDAMYCMVENIYATEQLEDLLSELEAYEDD